MAARDILTVGKRYKMEDYFLDICTSIDAPELV
eukprot:CAMPEP_0168313162 /NCGR_PEP_ID=MMETSP0210-20121227/163_1 /TAXON_ID=40633 /ORGANISM="Condylostoma magnum, Strain COL2" /LENGTH=32 /DNA_ID= /DNA_START= /DNA_END= /DNA_ORIENTATION=